MRCRPPEVLKRPTRRFLETDDAEDRPEEDTVQKDHNADHVLDFVAFVAKVKNGSLSALDVSLENSSQVLELSTHVLDHPLAD